VLWKEELLLKKVDYGLLLTFVAFFVFIGNMERVEAVRDLLSKILEGRELWLAFGCSQLISNVPAAILLSGFTAAYKELLIGVNIGGLGTLIASLASLISYKIFAVESDSAILDIPSTYYDIEPIITIECSGDISITINNQSFYLDGAEGTYILDCKNKLITKEGLNASNIMSGDFIKLSKGENQINYIGNITNFSIEYRKTYLWGG